MIPAISSLAIVVFSAIGLILYQIWQFFSPFLFPPAVTHFVGTTLFIIVGISLMGILFVTISINHLRKTAHLPPMVFIILKQ